MTIESPIKQAFKLKGRLYTITVIQLLDADADAFAEQLNKVVKQAPKMFQSTPVVLDLSQLNLKRIDFQRLKECLLAKQMIPVGVQGVHEGLVEAARLNGLAVFGATTQIDKELDIKKPQESSPQQNLSSTTQFIATPIRSGQQVYSQGDLIIASSVSRGAEVLADGNIHIYGSLRGRALAGIKGDESARIFCQELDAELLSIAGIYVLNDAIKQQTAGPKQIAIHEDSLSIDSIG